MTRSKSTWQPVKILGKGPWSLLPAQTWSVLTDFFIFAAGLSVFYLILVLARTWFGPFNPHVEISRDPSHLPLYAAYSLLRITIAYILSLAFTLVYGYVAAYNPRAERIMIPLLDILQSIPVLSFLPGVMLAMVALFPRHQVGVEMGAILLIFTGQVWNMAFSFYSSLKSIPRDMREAAKIYRFNWYQRFTQFELPYAAIGLVWNSMMSVAGGWFFLMACEMFVLGNDDFRLPGLGSYLQTAASAGDTQAILWGVGTMIAVIVLLDQIVWRPVIAWAEKFKVEQVESTDAPQSWFRDLLQGSRLLVRLRKRVVNPLRERVMMHYSRDFDTDQEEAPAAPWKVWVGRVIAALAMLGVLYAVVRAVGMLTQINGSDLHQILIGTAAT
ncbi:MAG: ABC transporter permease subunit, partial [Candidatus Korobacteraceae bacterium]